MAKVNSEQLPRQLKSAGLSPVYIVAGDENLLVLEACDAIRAAAKAHGYSERELFHQEAGFQWQNILESANSLSLFADKKVLELRLNNFKLGDAGSKVIQSFCANPPEDNLLLIICAKMDKRTQNTAWAKAVESKGTLVNVWPISDQQLPRWLDQRMKQANLKADSQALDILSSKVEGNLLAAAQEIEKLKLLTDDGFIDAQMMASAVADSARYNVFGLVDKVLAGDARSAAANLNGLKSEGTEATLVLWALAREIRNLLGIRQAHRNGQSIEMAAKGFGVFSNRLQLIKAGLKRLKDQELREALGLCALADKSIKGLNRQSPWQLLLEITLILSGNRSLSAKACIKLRTTTR